MSEKTITKNRFFVILVIFLCGLVSGCLLPAFSTEEDHKPQKKISKNFEKPKVIGKITSKEITESSGLTESKCDPKILWTHNDSGNGAFIYAINKKGEKLGTWKVLGATNNDWEDIAASKHKKGECFLYIADTGNNSRIRGEMNIFRVKEPKVSSSKISTNHRNPALTEAADKIRFVYPDIRRDSETLMIHPESGDIYILSKSYSGAASVYKLPHNYKKATVNMLEKIGKISVPAFPPGAITGGEISSDGKRIVVCDYFNAYEFTLPENEKFFDEIFKETPSVIDLGKREQGEAICYSADMNSIYATSEKKNSPLIEVKRKE